MQPNLFALRHVVRVLRKISEEQFNINFVLHKTVECGTIGCALGWATEDRWFIQQGFHTSEGLLHGLMVYQDVHGVNAITRFFSITRKQVQELFYAEGYRTFRHQLPKITRNEVINRINKFISQYEERRSQPHGHGRVLCTVSSR